MKFDRFASLPTLTHVLAIALAVVAVIAVVALLL